MLDFRDKRALIENLRVAARVLVPFYILFMTIARSYLETVPFSATGNHAYYLTTHHVFWFCATLFIGMLNLHFITRVPVKRLLWFPYGLYIILAPILWAWLTGNKLALAYHPTAPAEMFRDIFTFVWTAPHNRPVILDGGPAFLGIMLVTYFYTRSLKRSLLVGIISFGIINVFAVTLLGPTTTGTAIINLDSAMSYQPFISTWYLFVAFWALVGLMARAGVFSEGCRIWFICAMVGVCGWAIFSAAAFYAGWFPHHYDAFITGFPMGFCMFLLARVAMWMAGRPGNQWALGLFLLCLVSMAAVFTPIYAGNQEELALKPKRVRVWAREREPFSRLRLMPRGRFDFYESDRNFEDFEQVPEEPAERDYGQEP